MIPKIKINNDPILKTQKNSFRCLYKTAKIVKPLGNS